MNTRDLGSWAAAGLLAIAAVLGAAVAFSRYVRLPAASGVTYRGLPGATPIWRRQPGDPSTHRVYRIEDGATHCYVLVDPDGRGALACVPADLASDWQEDGR